jgi:predicted outer membrane protein
MGSLPAEASLLAKFRIFNLPARLLATRRSKMKKLEGAGGDFDRGYVQAEIEGHNKLQQIQEAYISVGQNQGQVDIAKLVRGMIKEHLTLLADIDKGGMRG